jgi:hypothetical protein
MWKEVWFRVFTIELPPYAKHDKIWSKKSAAWEVISSSAVYPQGFTGSAIICNGSGRLNKEQEPLGSVSSPYVKGVSEKFKRIGNRYIFKMIFKTKHTLGSSPTKTRPERDPLQASQCIYSIPCECGRSYIGETGRPLAVRLRDHRYNLQQGLLEKSKLGQHAYEEGHRIGWHDVGFWKLKVTSGIGNTRNWPIWHA